MYIPTRVSWQRDIYKCVSCNHWIGKGDIYCKNCGYKFTHNDTKQMIEKCTFISRFNAPEINNHSEHYKCNHCNSNIAIGDLFCKMCGHEFTKNDIEIIKEPFEKSNGYYLIPIFFFALVILFFIFTS